MEETFERELSRAAREGHPLSLVMIDVDDFKYINDHFGHRAGDAVLQTLGALLLENTRISDVACRYGGDEMLVVMPTASFVDALQRAHELRSAFSALGFTFGEMTHSTTISLGVASFPEHGRNPNELLGAADRALYVAKAKRNAVCGFDPQSMIRHPDQPSAIS
jgi:diguanylate cyclase (GGDEF)-like protein